ncbi:MAG TPA: hypothetical protein VJA94_02240 [Candidatus Angelobacter sp.]
MSRSHWPIIGVSAFSFRLAASVPSRECALQQDQADVCLLRGEGLPAAAWKDMQPMRAQSRRANGYCPGFGRGHRKRRGAYIRLQWVTKPHPQKRVSSEELARYRISNTTLNVQTVLSTGVPGARRFCASWGGGPVSRPKGESGG